MLSYINYLRYTKYHRHKNIRKMYSSTVYNIVVSSEDSTVVILGLVSTT